MGVSERFPISLNAVNIVCFKIDLEEKMLNVLLLKRSISPQKNKWSLPGGFVQGDETLEEAARRIFVTETGILPSYLNQFRSYSDTKRDVRVINQRSEQKQELLQLLLLLFIPVMKSCNEMMKVKIFNGLRCQESI